MTGLIQDRFLATVAKQPSARALVDGETALTYEEHDSQRAITAFLAILKTGAVYVPVDASSPAARLARIFVSAEPSFVLTAAVSTGRVAEVLQSTTDAAHLRFTSGSTGDPKGVVISHENVCHFVDWAIKYFGTHPGERISGHPPLHFDLSTFDIYATIGSGAELHLVPRSLNLLPGKIAGFIQDQEISQWFSVPSILTLLMRSGAMDDTDFPSLTRLLWCGEMMPTPTLLYLMDRLPGVAFTNLYGPTEATIASSYYTLDTPPATPTSPIPIGGVGLSSGYWRDPVKTAEAFFTGADGVRLYRTGDLAKTGPDDELLLLGRSDSQIKSRGYRIELGEIEAAIDALGLAQESAVVALDDDDAGKLVACAHAGLDVSGGEDAAVLALRKRLSASLPRYMIPVRWQSYEVLPKNANGKIDRRAIRESFEETNA